MSGRKLCRLKLDDYIALGKLHIYRGGPQETIGEGVAPGAGGQTTRGGGTGKP
jgi:hypothetical protein